jgi:hypothetical protein
MHFLSLFSLVQRLVRLFISENRRNSEKTSSEAELLILNSDLRI